MRAAPTPQLLFVLPSLGGGGAEAHIRRVAGELSRRGLSVSLAVNRRRPAFESDLAADIAFHPLGPERQVSALARLPFAALRLRRLIDRSRPDVVCAALDHANVAALLATRGAKTRPAVVIGAQNTLSVKFGSPPRPTTRVLHLLARRLYPSADLVLAASNGVANDFASLFPRVGAKVEVVHNAGWDGSVATLARAPLERPRPTDRPLIVACGRLTEQKGFDDLIDAAALLARQRPVAVWIVGEGPSRQRLERRISERGLAGQVELLGFRRNPYQIMAAADLFVLSSRWEGFGNVLVEAMVCGTPVVSTDCPHGPAEILDGGRYGVLVPPADPDALAAAIDSLLGEPQRLRALAAGGVERAGLFSAEFAADAYARLLTGAAQRRGRP